MMTPRSDLLSLYLHVPFCAKRCSYCAFNTYTHLERLIPAYVDALQREIQFVAEGATSQRVHTVFFGGGTPSVLSVDQIAQMLQTISQCFEVTSDCEITLEANPNDLNAVYLCDVQQVGINRLSIGVQSANQQELRLFERDHDFAEAVAAVCNAKSAGLNNLSVDLIYGAPGQTIDSWRNSLAKIIWLEVPHVSLYALGLEEGTAMHSWVSKGRLPALNDDLAADMYDLATAMLGQAGYQQYEISNWSMPGRECHHNLQYWRNLPYLGLGPGAHGYAGGVRYATMLSPHRYIQVMTASRPVKLAFPETPATVDTVRVSRHDEIVETMITGLRLTEEGLSRAAFRERFGVDVMDLYSDVLRHFADQGLLIIDENTIKVAPAGRLLTNLIFRALI